MTMREKQVPHDIEAEKSVLGMILNMGDFLSYVCDWLHPEHFYRDAHVSVYKAMLTLTERGEGIDPLSVSFVLKQWEVSIEDEEGGRWYLNGLADAALKQSLKDPIEQHANIVLDTAMARAGLAVCSEGANLLYTESALQALAKIERKFAELLSVGVKSDFTPLSDMTEAYLQRMEEGQKGKLIGISTGFALLDYLLGGFKKQKLILLAARPAIGKTSMALTLGYHAAKKGNRVGILSLEMGKEELHERLIALDARVDSHRLSNDKLETDEVQRVKTSIRRLDKLPIYIEDTFGCSVTELEGKARRLQIRHGLDILFVDYLQLMDADETREKDNEEKMLSTISRNLKGLARTLDIPVVALAQLNRALESRQSKVPTLPDLRGSGTLEQNADIVMFLYRDKVYNVNTERGNEADIIVAKHRAGPTGTVTVRFDESQTRFYDIISDEEAARYA